MTITEQAHVNFVSFAINHCGRCKRTLRAEWNEKCNVGMEIALYVNVCSICPWWENSCLHRAEHWKNASSCWCGGGRGEGKKRSCWIAGCLCCRSNELQSTKRNLNISAPRYTDATARSPVDGGEWWRSRLPRLCLLSSLSSVLDLNRYRRLWCGCHYQHWCERNG